MKIHKVRRKIRLEVFTTVNREVREGLMIKIIFKQMVTK